MNELRNPVRFLGCYRTGVTRENVGLYLRVAKTLLRCGPQGEGALANRVRENLGSAAWNECMEKLAAWGIVEFEPARTGRARIVGLTEAGKGAVEFTDEIPDSDAQEAEGSLAK